MLRKYFDLNEYEKRMDRALAALTLGELEPIVADLPPTEQERRQQDRQAIEQHERKELREYLGEWGFWGFGGLVMTAIWGFQSLHAGALKFYWPMVPLGIWALIVISYAIWPKRD